MRSVIRAIVISFVALIIFGSFPHAPVLVVKSQGSSVPTRSLPPTPPPHNSSSAPGYCTVVAGSRLYESISAVTYALQPGDTLVITVVIWIANPTGCISGNPCPEYDSSPEYINGWVDWDGDKVFESNERVLDSALTGYIGINYYGSMSTSNIVTVPSSAVSSTWMRVNLGWGYDPNDPCEYSWTWGDIVDTEVVLGPQIRSFEIRGGMSKYEGNFENVVFRRGIDYPRFEVAVAAPPGDEVKVEISRKQNTLATLDTIWHASEGKYVVEWDWKSNTWNNIPSDVPVGEYRARAKIVAKDGTKLVASDEKAFYVIFDTPVSLNAAERQAFLYDDTGTRDNNGVWFGASESDNWFGWDYGRDFACIYYLHPWDSRVFSRAITRIDGETSPSKAAEALLDLEANMFSYSLSYHTNDVIDLLEHYTEAQCADDANMLTALIRSVGIAAHPVTADANLGRAGWTFDTWTEAFLDGTWYVFHPHEDLGPNNRIQAGTTWGVAEKSPNDIIIMAGPYWEASNLDDESKDAEFRYFVIKDGKIEAAPHPKDGRPLEALDFSQSWIIELSKEYWGVGHEDPLSAQDQKNVTLDLTLDKSNYEVGESLNITYTISNFNSSSVTSNLTIWVISDDPYSPMWGDQVLDSFQETITVPSNENYSGNKEYRLPFNLSSSNNYFAVAAYAEEKVEASFLVRPLYNISTTIPSEVTLDSPVDFTVGLTISNDRDEVLKGLTVNLGASYNLIVSDPDKYVEELLPHSEIALNWTVQALKDDIATLYFKIASETAGASCFAKHVTILSGSRLTVVDKFVTLSGELGESSEVEFEVQNAGDLNATDVSVQIFLPENITASNTIWNIGELVGGEGSMLHTNLTLSKFEDFVIDVLANDGVGHTAKGIIYIHLMSTFVGTFNDVYSDYGVDTNNDGLYDYLVVDVGVNVTNAGACTVDGRLYDTNGNEIMQVGNYTYLDSGNQTVMLCFNGFSIYKHSATGLYTLNNLLLFNENGTLIDCRDYAYTTKSYNNTDFQHLVVVTGSYSDYGTDVDGDLIFESLTIDIQVILLNPGYCVIRARLMDSAGQEILWAENTTYLQGKQPQIIQLNFDGAAIYNHKVDGPYHLRDVYIYHTGDPGQPDYVLDAYTTKAYEYTRFGEITYGVEVSIDPLEAVVQPASTIAYNVSITNTGITLDTFSVTLQGLNPSWYSLSETSVTICPFCHEPTVNVTLTVSTPSNVTPGNYTFSVTATSQGNSSVFDSATGKLIVEVTVYNITFDQTGVCSDFAGTVVTIDGVNYTVVTLPASFWWDNNTVHPFAYQSPLFVGSGAKQYDWNYTNGLSTSQTGSIIVTGLGSVTGNYVANVHDVAVTNVTANLTWVYQGRTADINVTVWNDGDFIENVNVTLYYNITANEVAGKQNVTLLSGESKTLLFVWNTAAVPYCHNYTLTAVATIPADNTPADNTLSDGNITVRIMGEINDDGKVDITDVSIAAKAFGSRPDNPRWNPDADVNGDGKVDIVDIAMIARNFGKSGIS